MWIPVDHKYYFLQIWGLTEKSLTHWGMYASENLAIIGLENGMSPVQCQAIIRTNDGMLLSHWSRDKMAAHF